MSILALCDVRLFLGGIFKFLASVSKEFSEG